MRERQLKGIPHTHVNLCHCRSPMDNRVLVFVLYKKEASCVERAGRFVSVHGDKAQDERTRSLALFKYGTCPLMIATDVAARGLDIPDVEVVIIYSFPFTTKGYVQGDWPS
ncbi:hypothetical protein C5167_050464 [Papaver somniferum]|uniref:Helicase C-terminal domain-containing protein n=1 Tax=Papaver somniferum TaxID=3469 RepID=A0A4Y7KRH9_PAPSO|nr:hypothetical protein C5167_050464 [Papaver somniferum]